MPTITQAIRTGYETRIVWTVDSQSIANNTSTITAKVQLVSKGSSYNIVSSATKSGSLWVNGSKYDFTFSAALSGNQVKTVYTKTVIVPHNSDGTKVCGFAAALGIEVTLSGTYYGTVEIRGEGTLATIPRASTATISPSTVEMGKVITFTISRASSSFTHKITYKFGSKSGTIASAAGTSATWTVPLSLAEALPNGTSGSGTITIQTLSGSTVIGSKSLSFKATVPASVVPTISAINVFEAVSGIAAQFKGYVQNKSKLKVSVSAAGVYGSTIKTYKTTIQSVNYSGASFTSNTLSKSGAFTVVSTVVDSRGRSAQRSISLSAIAYSSPAINAFSGFRCDSDGSSNYDGEYLNLKVNFQIASVNSLNTKSYKIEYKLKTASEWTQLQTGSVYSLNSSIITTQKFSVNSAFDLRLTVTDFFGTVTSVLDVPTAFTLIDLHSSGKGIAFGKVSEKQNVMEVALDAEFNNDLVRKGNEYVFSSPGVAGTAGFILMAKIKIIETNADSPITFVLTRRTAKTPMSVYIKFKSSSIDPDLDSICYEGENYGAFVVKSAASTWDFYVQKSSAYDTIAIQNWFATYTMGTRISVTFPGSLVSAVPTPFYRATPAELRSLLDYIYPVGSIYISYSHTSPASLFGGTWVRIENAFLWGVDSSGQIGLTGGAKEVTLSVDQIPAHAHGSVYSQHASGTKDKAWYNTSGSSVAYGTVSTGGGKAHNNMPPYIQVSIWRRTE